MIKAIYFDFDGTIANTAEGIILTMQESFKAMGLAVPAAEDIKRCIGLPLLECFSRLGTLDEARAAYGVDVYRSLFPIYELTHITLFDGVSETIKTLAAQGLRLAICTSRGKGSLESILTGYGLWDYFETVVTHSDHLPAKPAPDMVLTLLSRMRLDADEVIVVGDTTFDILMGNSAGCRTAAVTYGNHTRERLMTASPSYMINSFSDLLPLIAE